MGKVGRKRKWGRGMRSFLGVGKSAWPTGNEVYLHTGCSTSQGMYRWSDRQVDRQTDGRAGLVGWASLGYHTHRNSEDFLWIPLLCLPLTLPSHPSLGPAEPHLPPRCTLDHCEEWKFKGTPSPTPPAQPRKDSLWGVGGPATQLREQPEKNSNWCGCFFFFFLI